MIPQMRTKAQVYLVLGREVTSVANFTRKLICPRIVTCSVLFNNSCKLLQQFLYLKIGSGGQAGARVPRTDPWSGVTTTHTY